MMTQQEYSEWWIALPDDWTTLDEPIHTLVGHVSALQDRIDELPDELRCCCAYDHPTDVCMSHNQAARRGAEAFRRFAEAFSGQAAVMVDAFRKVIRKQEN